MSNGYYNGQTRVSLGKGGKGPSPGTPGGGGMAFKEKPGFKTGAPGKKQADRSGGVKRAPVNPGDDGV
jgi:hypothetical protein